MHGAERATDLDEVVEESSIECFGERVSRVGGLLLVERHLHALFTFPHSTDELRAQRLGTDAEQVRRKVQVCNTQPITASAAAVLRGTREPRPPLRQISASHSPPPVTFLVSVTGHLG